LEHFLRDSQALILWESPSNNWKTFLKYLINFVCQIFIQFLCRQANYPHEILDKNGLIDLLLCDQPGLLSWNGPHGVEIENVSNNCSTLTATRLRTSSSNGGGRSPNRRDESYIFFPLCTRG
jgi:hypothetical protein